MGQDGELSAATVSRTINFLVVGCISMWHAIVKGTAFEIPMTCRHISNVSLTTWHANARLQCGNKQDWRGRPPDKVIVWGGFLVDPLCMHRVTTLTDLVQMSENDVCNGLQQA